MEKQIEKKPKDKKLRLAIIFICIAAIFAIAATAAGITYAAFSRSDMVSYTTSGASTGTALEIGDSGPRSS